MHPLGEAIPFVCITLGDEPLATARHGHRRAWQTTNDFSVGPWLGLSRADGMEIVSTSHMVVDGFGHACLTGQIHALAEVATAERLARGAWSAGHAGHGHVHAHWVPPPLPPITGGVIMNRGLYYPWAFADYELQCATASNAMAAAAIFM